MYINTFKYTPEDVDCKLCTEYVKKFGCTACGSNFLIFFSYSLILEGI